MSLDSGTPDSEEYHTEDHLQLDETVHTLRDSEKRYATLKEKAGRFRVLIIGGANAGKTTILKKICGTTDEPDIYDRHGTKIDVPALEPTIMRGEHDIANKMIFPSNPTLVFHDSRGFEAGGADEFRKVKDFVAERAKSKKLKNQVHVIWYCVAMDDDRPVTYAEKQFFSVLGTGKVPVIVVFTKCEALELKAIQTLEEAGCDFDEAMQNTHKYIEEHMKNIQGMFEKMVYPPKGYVFLQEMEKPEGGCQALVKCTADVLDSNILQGLFISTQQNSLELAMEFSLRQPI
ncbi:hypothetical protein BDZ94DRAFT_1307246 [Collybia nuda]|uniref:G domain-containing protein n=1 Tax=Collybia nuda TaxID=64659 RepID=A0A9P5YCX8_9AGAR|nr:hypothetical protein BDZ94DRAFT_1307246 [Collybia nuda]